MQLNQGAFSAVTKLWVRAQQLGACEPGHFLLPGNWSWHTKSTDPLKGKHGFNVDCHQQSWSSAWRTLRAAAAASVEKRAKDNRELTFSERKDAAVLKSVGFHSMRRTFITAMAERNVPLPVTMAMVGHKSPQMTDRYTQISSDAQRQAVELLNKTYERTPFVEVFVEKQQNRQPAVSKSLN